MNSSAVLLCSRAGIATDALPDAAVVEDLCERPAAAAAALREAGAGRVVLGLCERRPSAELVAALRRAGAVPFGIETVALAGVRPPDEAARLVAAARAKLDALRPGEHGRPVLNGSGISRRTLFSLGGAVRQVQVAALDETACAGTARCGICVGACPEAAIAATTPAPTVDAGACTACGLCVPRCPHGALRITGAATAQTEAQLEQLVPGVRGVVLACAAAGADAPPGWALVELPTLALLTPGWILQLRARDVEVRLAPCEGPCCAGVAAVEELAGRVLAAGRSPRSLLPGRIRLTEPAATAEAIRSLVPRGAGGVLEGEASPLGVPAVDAARCTLCGACAVACPTEALRLDEGTEESALRLRADACVPCGRCAAACPERAIGVHPGIDLGRLERGTVDLAHAPRETCSACGADLPPVPMRRRLQELLPELSDVPLDLCARCARSAGRRGETASTSGSRTGLRHPARRS